MEIYKAAEAQSNHPLCYNGDLFTEGHYKRFMEQFPDTGAVMLGRGMLVNPALVRQIQGQGALTKEELQQFHDRLCSKYEEVMSGDNAVLFKMKELWFFMGNLFPDNKKYLKKIKKSQHLAEYRQAAESLFRYFEMCIPGK